MCWRLEVGGVQGLQCHRSPSCHSTPGPHVPSSPPCLTPAVAKQRRRARQGLSLLPRGVRSRQGSAPKGLLMRSMCNGVSVSLLRGRHNSGGAKASGCRCCAVSSESSRAKPCCDTRSASSSSRASTASCRALCMQPMHEVHPLARCASKEGTGPQHAQLAGTADVAI
jgi:hypothetical protein